MNILGRCFVGIRFLTVALLLLGLGVHAQNIERFEVTVNTSNTAIAGVEIKGLILVSSNGSNARSCGIRVDFGDGSPAQLMEVPINQQAEFKFKYSKAGIFPIIVKGEGISRFLAGLAPCQGQMFQVASIVDPAQLEDGSLDVVIMARTRPGRRSANLRFASNLDGTAKLMDVKSPLCLNTALLKANVLGRDDTTVMREIFDNRQFGILSGSDLYRQAGVLDVQKVLANFYDKSLKMWGHSGNEQCNSAYASRDFSGLRLMFNMSEVIAVPKWLLPSLQRVPSLSEIQNYSPWMTLTVQQAKQMVLDSQQKSMQNSQLVSQVVNEFTVLAQSNSKDKVGSLVISDDRIRSRNKNQALNVCTLTYKDQDGSAVQGYLGQNLSMLLPDMKERYTQAGWSIAKSFNKVFDHINDAFIDISRQPDVCHIFVDYPHNLAALDVGFKRANTLTTSLGMLIDSTTARDLFSTQRGFSDYATYQFARSISASANDLKKLNAAGITNKMEFEALLAEIKHSQYANTQELSIVFSYLSDRDNGKVKKISAVAERDLRVAEEKLRRDKEDLERQRRKDAFAREFPYEAVISCEFQGSHTNLVSCFAGDVGTELEIRNGSNYGMYKAFDLYRLGREQPREGLVLPLSANFEMKAQNSNDTLTLTIKIRETATGRIIYTKSAAKYGVIRVNR
jgi:hypothetical protein